MFRSISYVIGKGEESVRRQLEVFAMLFCPIIGFFHKHASNPLKEGFGQMAKGGLL
jgi:hypothetical protein